METIDHKFCSNCKRDILASNYEIHSIHCQRNLTVCVKCNEPVPITDLTDHNHEFHSEIKCSDCNLFIENQRLDVHRRDSCSSRLISCKICGIDIPANEMNIHEYYCGCRTEKCSECGEIVMLKYLELHLDSNHTFIKLDDEPGPGASWLSGSNKVLNKYALLNDLVKPLSKVPNSNQDARPIHINRVSPVKRNNDQPQINTAYWLAKQENKKPSIRTENDELLEELFDDMDLSTIRSSSKSLETYNSAKHSGAKRCSGASELSNVMLPCEFCDQLIPADELVLHETGCQPEVSCYKPKLEVPHGNILRESDSEEEMDDCMDLIPCEFCGALFSVHKIENHHMRCNFANLTSSSSVQQINQIYDNAPLSRKVSNHLAASNSTLSRLTGGANNIGDKINSGSSSVNLSLSNYDKKQTTFENPSSSDGAAANGSTNNYTGVIRKQKAGRTNNLINQPYQIPEEVPSSSSSRETSRNRLENFHANKP